MIFPKFQRDRLVRLKLQNFETSQGGTVCLQGGPRYLDIRPESFLGQKPPGDRDRELKF